MKTSIVAITLALVAVFSPEAQAHGWGGHCGGGRFSFGIGFPLFFGGYYGAPAYYGSPGYGYGYGYASRPYYYSAAPYRSYGSGYSSNVGANVQSELAHLGYYHGEIDGIIGPMSRDAIRHFQASHGLPVTGAIDTPLLRSLRL